MDIDIQAIKSFARKRFLNPQDAEDFVQTVYERWLSGRKACLRKLHIDELRVQRGDKRKEKKFRNKIPHSAYVEFHDYMLNIKPRDHIADKDAAARLNKIYKLNRIAIILVDWWGMSFWELGYVLNITESGAALLYKRAVKEIQNID